MKALLRFVFFCSFVSVTAAKLPDDMTGTLLVVNKSDDSVSFIDIASGKTIDTLATGKGPHELVITDDGKWAVSTDYVGGNSLTVIDIANRKVARTIDLTQYQRPHGIQFLADQSRVVVSSEASQKVVIADIHAGVIVKAIDTTQPGSHMVAMPGDSKIAYTTNMQGNTLSVVDMEKGSFIKTIKTEKTPEAIIVSRSGHEVWYGANDQGLVVATNAVTGDILGRWKDFRFPYRILLTRDERVAIVPDFRNHYVRFFDAQAKSELGTLRLEEQAGPQGIILHPNDKTAFLSLNAKNKVLAIDVNSRQVLAEFKTGNNPDGIGYSAITY